MLGSLKAESPETRGTMSRGVSGALSDRTAPRANSNGCADGPSPPLQDVDCASVVGAFARVLCG